MPCPDLDAVNAVLATLGPFRLDRRNGATGPLQLEIKERWRQPVRVRNDGLWFASRIVSNLMGGTDEQATVQLIRWYRDQPRRGLQFWQRVVGDRDCQRTTIPLLEAGGYFDPARVGCVRCAAPDATDWWTHGPVGPCCFGGCVQPAPTASTAFVQETAA